MKDSSSIYLESALRCAERGWPVLPIVLPKSSSEEFFRKTSADGKCPAIKNWQNDATTDPAQIRQWFAERPYNVAILTGARSGVWVLDVDGESGAESLRTLEAANTPLPRTLTAITARGEHRYFACPPNTRIPCSASKIAKGLDVRGDGGFIIAPPSLHATGKRYQWLDETVPVADAPHWLLSLVTEAKIPVGARNDFLFARACALQSSGMRPNDVSTAIHLLNSMQCNPPVDTAEVQSILDSASRYDTPATKRESKRHHPLFWYQFFCLDFLSCQEIATMLDYQVGWHAKLTASAWLRGGVLPDNDEKLFKLAGARSRKAFLREKNVALFEFVPVELNGERVLVNRAMAENWSAALDRWMQTKAARAARESKRDKPIEVEGMAA